MAVSDSERLFEGGSLVPQLLKAIWLRAQCRRVQSWRMLICGENTKETNIVIIQQQLLYYYLLNSIKKRLISSLNSSLKWFQMQLLVCFRGKQNFTRKMSFNRLVMMQSSFNHLLCSPGRCLGCLKKPVYWFHPQRGGGMLKAHYERIHLHTAYFIFRELVRFTASNLKQSIRGVEALCGF